jgi:hypothetical protein
MFSDNLGVKKIGNLKALREVSNGDITVTIDAMSGYGVRVSHRRHHEIHQAA